MLMALLLLIAAPSVKPVRVPPVDQCAKAPGFAAFRQELIGVIARKDVPRLLALSDAKIQLSFGDDIGHAAMRKMWDLDRPGQSTLWNELGKALKLGCALTEGVAVAPSMAHVFPDDADPIDTMVVVKPVTLRAAASDTSRAIAALQWDLLTVEAWDGKSPWAKVKLKDGRLGFLPSDAIRSPIDYRAIFERKGGRWRMTAFVAGD
jgi:hypothetical protein